MRYYVVVVLLIAHILIESGCGTDTMDYKADGGFWVWRWLTNWTGTSPTMLRAVEKKILSFMKTPYKAFFVDIGPAIGASDKIWTISLNEESKEVPLVMLHGFGAGVALWVMNLESLSKDRPVYAMDVLGFGRSSRPKFSTDPLIAEKQFVKSVEEWRNEMKLNKMILLGHSMGGYIATSYALSYPDRVKHLILADPWGFPEKNTESTSKKMPLWVRAVGYMVTSLNPLWILRASGPFGQWLVQKTRPDIMRKFSSTLEGDLNLLPQYIHQCNAQTPSGETAFHTMMEAFGWARNPMIRRCKDVREDIPITFIYGSRSWIESSSGEKIKAQRVNSVVDIKFVNGAGHHVYADKPEVFNRYVNETCDIYRLRDGIAGMGQRGAGYIREATESDEENDIRIPIATTREKSPEAEQSPPQTQPSAPTAPQEPTPTPAASKN